MDSRLGSDDKYLQYLYGGKELPKSGPDMVDRNIQNFRSKEFVSDPELLVAGCSFTYGSGVPSESRWGDLLASKLSIERYCTVATPGISINELVDNLFSFFTEYGNPKILVALLPDPYRVTVPVDEDVTTTEAADKMGVNGTSLQTTKKSFRRIYTDYEYEKYSEVKFIKKPFPIEAITSKDFAIYSTIRSIRHLEQYCKSSGITLIWSTWSHKLFSEINMYVHGDLSFEYYSSDISNMLACKRSSNSEKLYFYRDWESLNYCSAHHDYDACAECAILGCHMDSEYLDSDVFSVGNDVENGIHAAHHGIHFHLHCSESFYEKIMEKT